MTITTEFLRSLIKPDGDHSPITISQFRLMMRDLIEEIASQEPFLGAAIAESSEAFFTPGLTGILTVSDLKRYSRDVFLRSPERLDEFFTREFNGQTVTLSELYDLSLRLLTSMSDIFEIESV